MLEHIEQAAQQSVSRACGFGMLTIATFMIGMSGMLQLALKCGGLMMLLMAAILALKAILVRRQPYRSTETWLILAKQHRPAPEVAQKLISGVLHDVYVEHAVRSAFGAALLLAAAMVYGFISPVAT